MARTQVRLFGAVALSLVLAAGQVACAKRQVLVRPQAGDVQKHASPGDRVRVSTRDGRDFSLLLVEVKPDRVTGTDPDSGAPREVAVEDILAIEIESTEIWNPAMDGLAYLVGAAGLVVLFRLAGYLRDH